MNIREFGHYFAHNRKGLLNRLVMEYHIPIRPWWSIFWHEAHLYDSLEVRGMDVIDVGCDYGVTPMYFLARGARSVTGFSEWEPRFYHSAYLHHTGRTTAARITMAATYGTITLVLLMPRISPKSSEYASVA